jgi:uncharacterized protein (TIGR03067 family)
MSWYSLTVAILLAGISQPTAAHDTKEEAVMKDMKMLTGTWTVVSAERDGKKLTDEQIKGISLTIEGTGKTSVRRGDQLLFEGTLAIDPTKKPKTMDSTQTSDGENKGKTTLSIYEVEGDTLKLCSAEPGKDRPTEFAAKSGSGHFLREFKRDKK